MKAVQEWLGVGQSHCLHCHIWSQTDWLSITHLPSRAHEGQAGGYSRLLAFSSAYLCRSREDLIWRLLLWWEACGAGPRLLAGLWARITQCRNVIAEASLASGSKKLSCVHGPLVSLIQFSLVLTEEFLYS